MEGWWLLPRISRTINGDDKSLLKEMEMRGQRSLNGVVSQALLPSSGDRISLPALLQTRFVEGMYAGCGSFL